MNIEIKDEDLVYILTFKHQYENIKIDVGICREIDNFKMITDSFGNILETSNTYSEGYAWYLNNGRKRKIFSSLKNLYYSIYNSFRNLEISEERRLERCLSDMDRAKESIKKYNELADKASEDYRKL